MFVSLRTIFVLPLGYSIDNALAVYIHFSAMFFATQYSDAQKVASTKHLAMKGRGTGVLQTEFLSWTCSIGTPNQVFSISAKRWR